MSFIEPYVPQSLFDSLCRAYWLQPETAEETAEGYRRLGEWWDWKQYHARFDRCCHGKRP